MIERDQLITVLHRALEPQDWIRAAFLGGSDATGRRDRWSDIDLVCFVEPDRAEETLTLLKRAVETLSPVQLEWRVPSPTWHGHEQVFWRLRDAGEHLMIDLVVVSTTSPPGQRFLETERHGTPVVLFDRDGLIRPQPMDWPAHRAKMRARLDRLRRTFPIFQTIIKRAVERGQPCDAAHWYMQLAVLPTVEVLRMRHCPERFDFGMRYLADDLPAPVYQRLCKVVLPGSLEGIRGGRDELEQMFTQAVSELDADPEMQTSTSDSA